jgi:predicted nucleic-acid-binding protein
MIALDTNVLVRYITRDDPVQFHKAEHVIDGAQASGERLFLSPIVLCELVWVLRSIYGLRRTEIAGCLDQVLRTSQFELPDSTLVWHAFMDYRNGKADFADCLIGRLARQHDCTRTLTFDAGLKENDLFDVL